MRRGLSGQDLAAWYLGTACAAVVAAAVAGAAGVSVYAATGLGCRRVTGGDVAPDGELACPDGTGLAIPGLACAALGAFAVLAVSAALLARRADPPALVRAAGHAMLLAAGSVAAPLSAWAALAFASEAAWPVLAAAAACAVAAAPPLVSARWPRRAPAAVAACLAPAVTILALGFWLPLLVPVCLVPAGAWSVALYLLRAARGRAAVRAGAT